MLTSLSQARVDRSCVGADRVGVRPGRASEYRQFAKYTGSAKLARGFEARAAGLLDQQLLGDLT